MGPACDRHCGTARTWNPSSLLRSVCRNGAEYGRTGGFELFGCRGDVSPLLVHRRPKRYNQCWPLVRPRRVFHPHDGTFLILATNSCGYQSAKCEKKPKNDGFPEPRTVGPHSPRGDRAFLSQLASLCEARRFSGTEMCDLLCTFVARSAVRSPPSVTPSPKHISRWLPRLP